MPRLERGRIVKAEVLDPAGRNPKVRRLVIVTETEEIQPGEPFVCVAVTATLPRRLTAEYVLLPWDRRGHRVTGCTKLVPAVGCRGTGELLAQFVIGPLGVVVKQVAHSFVDVPAQEHAGPGGL